MLSPSRRQLIVGAAALGATASATGLTRVIASIATIAGPSQRELVDVSGLGVLVPPGFAVRLLARSGDTVGDTAFVWHDAPDGGGVVERPDGGWSYVSNSEVGGGGGGASVIDFDVEGNVIGARSVLSGTSRNCAGGVTPWATWLSCEEVDGGQVFECDVSAGVVVERPALGKFRHEAAAVHPESGAVFLTEDRPTGRLYRFTPDVVGDLSTGLLEAAHVSLRPADMSVGEVAQVVWEPTSADQPDRSSSTSPFNGSEGAWIDDDRLLFTTKGDCRIWTLDVVLGELRVLHDCDVDRSTPLDDVDNVVVHAQSGQIYVAEDTGNMELCVIWATADGGLQVQAFLRILGQAGSEVAGPAFSPDGRRLYVSSQRGRDGRGLVYEITGPFDPVISGPADRAGLAPAERL